MSNSGARALLFVALSAPIGCSLLFSAGDFDGPGGACTADCGTPGPDGGDEDTGHDAPGSRFCEQQQPAPTFCHDFDDGRLERDDFKPNAAARARAFLESTDAASPPAAFVVELPSGTANESPYMVYKVDTKSFREARLSFDIQIDHDQDSEAAKVVDIVESLTGSGRHSVGLYIGNGNGAIQERRPDDGGYASTTFMNHFPKKRAWTHVDLSFERNGSRAIAKLDGRVVAEHPLSAAWQMAEFELRVGINYVKPESGAWRFRYDNVVFDVKN